MKPGNTWEAALVYSDYVKELGDEASGERWVLVSKIQRCLEEMRAEWLSRRTPRTRSLHLTRVFDRSILAVKFCRYYAYCDLYVRAKDGYYILSHSGTEQCYTIRSSAKFNLDSVERNGLHHLRHPAIKLAGACHAT